MGTASDRLLPGYGWIFGMGDGTVNVGLGILNTSAAFGKIDYRDLLAAGWRHARRVGLRRGEPDAADPRRRAADGLQPQPHYTRGLLLVGDAGGMVNPFNGEGIAYAMESGELAAEVVAQALARPDGPARSGRWQATRGALKDAYGGYYTLGRMFVKLIGHPRSCGSPPGTACRTRR